MLKCSVADQRLLEQHRTLLERALEPALDSLYAVIGETGVNAPHFRDEAHRERARRAQAGHWRSLFTTAQPHEWSRAAAIGQAHASAGVDHTIYLGGAAIVLGKLIREIAAEASAGALPVDRLGAVSEALIKRVLFDLSLGVSAYLDVKERENVERARFVASLAHDLRTPLHAVIGYSELLLEETPPQAQGATDLANVLAAARRLNRTLEGVLSLARIYAGLMPLSPEPVDASITARCVIDALRDDLLRSGNVIEEPRGQGPLVHADPEKLSECLAVVLGNAGRFTSGGKISVQVERRLVNGVDAVVFQIRDTGVGMSAEQLNMLFQPGPRAASGPSGAPVGLSVVRELLRLMGGDIEAHSRVNCGSLFSLWLPAAERRPV